MLGRNIAHVIDRISFWYRFVFPYRAETDSWRGGLPAIPALTANPQIARKGRSGPMLVGGVHQSLLKFRELRTSEPLSPARRTWLRGYHSFSWLDDLDTLADDPHVQKMIAKQLRRWLRLYSPRSLRLKTILRYRQHGVDPWDHDVAVYRLSQWLRHSDLLERCLAKRTTNTTDLKTWRDLMIWQAMRMRRYLSLTLIWRDLHVSCWHLYAHMMSEKAIIQNKSTSTLPLQAVLVRCLAGNFRDDGLPLDGSPQTLLKKLVVFAEIERFFKHTKQKCPELILQTLSYGAQLLRRLRHGDNGFVVVNGGLEDDTVLINRFIQRYARRIKPTDSLGILRLVSGKCMVFIDCTSGPKFTPSTAAPLAMEFSDGKHRIIVNSGVPLSGHHDGAGQSMFCSTAAHSTVVINDTNARQAHSPEGKIRHNRADIDIKITPLLKETTRSKSPSDSLAVEASHTGYRPMFGMAHVRRVALSSSGEKLTGSDCLIGPAGLQFSLRFHLHPAIVIAPFSQGHAVLIKCSTRRLWRFNIDRPIVIEDSIYWGSGHYQRCRCLLISGLTQKGETWLRWTWSRYL